MHQCGKLKTYQNSSTSILNTGIVPEEKLSEIHDQPSWYWIWSQWREYWYQISALWNQLSHFGNCFSPEKITSESIPRRKYEFYNIVTPIQNFPTPKSAPRKNIVMPMQGLAIQKLFSKRKHWYSIFRHRISWSWNIFFGKNISTLIAESIPWSSYQHSTTSCLNTGVDSKKKIFLPWYKPTWSCNWALGEYIDTLM